MIEFETKEGCLSITPNKVTGIQYKEKHLTEITICGKSYNIIMPYPQVMERLKPKNPELEAAVIYYKWLVRLSFENGYRNGFNHCADNTKADWKLSWDNSKVKGKLDG